MKKIAILDPSILSLNLGDEIIMESTRDALRSLTEDAFVVDMPTHAPIFHLREFWLRTRVPITDIYDRLDYKFVCGTNLLVKNRIRRRNIWNLGLLDLQYIHDFIVVGVGSDGLDKPQNEYTKRFYEKALSHEYYHSTRDEQTKVFLESMGFKALNTGCATLWKLTEEHCRQIPTKKADSVVFTLTDYQTAEDADRELIQILLRNYRHVTFWPQGFYDADYFQRLYPDACEDRVRLLQPNLRAFTDFLQSTDCDYVGTRLHGGIKAMQLKKRAVILGVDNRARDMNKSANLNYLERAELASLEQMINGDIVTDVHLDRDSIQTFLGQFS